MLIFEKQSEGNKDLSAPVCPYGGPLDLEAAYSDTSKLSLKNCPYHVNLFLIVCWVFKIVNHAFK